MANIGKAPDTFEGLRRDPNTGHYRVLPGYGYYANRFKINETWLDEDDDLWIDGSAVERVWQEGGPGAFQAQVTFGQRSAGAA
jgi:hypothetical protein